MNARTDESLNMRTVFNLSMSDDMPQSDIPKIIDLSETLRKIEFAARGIYFDSTEGVYKKSEYLSPIMNDKGINEVMNILHTLFHMNNAFNDLSELDIGKITLETWNRIKTLMLTHIKEFDIKETKRISPFCGQIKVEIQLFLTHSRNGGLRKVYENTMGEKITHSPEKGIAKKITDGIFGG